MGGTHGLAEDQIARQIDRLIHGRHHVVHGKAMLAAVRTGQPLVLNCYHVDSHEAKRQPIGAGTAKHCKA